MTMYADAQLSEPTGMIADEPRAAHAARPADLARPVGSRELSLADGRDPQSAILAIVAEEERLYRRMAAVSEAKRDALLTNDVDALTPLVREMEGIAAVVERLEADRLAQAARLAEGDEQVGDSFAALLPYFNGADLDRLEALRGHLRETVQQVRTLNELNAALVRQALVFTDQWTRLIRASMPATYAPTGTMTGAVNATRSWHV